jgi:predicted Zn-dependent peptidase
MIQQFTLPNGLRLVHQFKDSPVAHVGLFIHTGSRDELENEHGLAHFIEHTIFKGTEKRNVYQILNRLEHVGADLDAFTTKEETCVNATFLNEYYPRTLELFSDIFFHSIFPQHELEKEKMVVADEIRSYLDSPAEQIFDDFEDLVFAGHALGRNILGTVRSLKRFNREAILKFIGRNYDTSQVVISSVGKIRFEKLCRLVEKHFNQRGGYREFSSRSLLEKIVPFRETRRKKVNQVHCILGGWAYPFHDPRRLPMAVLNNLLGGPLMNSRLSLALRERHGLTYNNESSYTAYSDAGIISIYFGVEALQFEKAQNIVLKELKRLREEKLSTIQLQRVRKQVEGQLAISGESNMATMMAMGKSYLIQDRFDTIEMILQKIEKITSEELLEIANEVLREEGMGMLVYK